MQRSTSRILTTHTGSLPRPRQLTRLYAFARVASHCCGRDRSPLARQGDLSTAGAAILGTAAALP